MSSSCDHYLIHACAVTLTPRVLVLLTRGVTVEAASDVRVSWTDPGLHSSVTHVISPVHTLASLVLASSPMDISDKGPCKCDQKEDIHSVSMRQLIFLIIVCDFLLIFAESTNIKINLDNLHTHSIHGKQ